mmetsp:Transcript_10217/g.15596  ORF Transcript_10217/g.15596 Transcript_10217/m.15596 type:complete len:263 (-) Transcript_10217:29-817(-)|eukprot:CAMPEP_0194239344 /NCGR_PEP_ID=MMETSP0158-20130606/5839_1 /TAXON_ID=33649 /ORGANISM="Thalassionema nitzschioides, Strain L26-B" /LENGTH=262 /DNA_ID=CAMNT_0038973799 /DNA_START=87 /DNA_END=875 /DNA_ORIENTATION=-
MRGAIILLILSQSTLSFQFPNLGGLFKPPSILDKPPQVSSKKIELLNAISSTANGKTATLDQQRNVLGIVRELELECPVSPTILSDPTEIKALDGTWFLQYTSPSKVEDDVSNAENNWKAIEASEGEANIETKQIKSKGSVSAAGLTVDTSNRVVKQVFNTDESTVYNVVELDFGVGRAGGTFRPSPNVLNRAIVAFDEASITFKNGFVLNLGWIFGIIGFIKNSRDNGWLETTYVDKDIRIGRGNKGTLFVLTRDSDAVQP